MTEPTRDALHAASIAELEHRAAFIAECGYHGDVKLYEYAAACVKRVPELEALAEFRRCELEAVRIENLGVRAENRRLEAEVERLRASERFVAALDSGGITQVIPKPGLRHGYVRVWDRAGECFEGPDTLAAYAAATREGTDATNA